MKRILIPVFAILVLSSLSAQSAEVTVKDGGLRVYLLEDNCETSDLKATGTMLANGSKIDAQYTVIIHGIEYVVFEQGNEEHYVAAKYVKGLVNVPIKIFQQNFDSIVSINSGGAKVYKNGKVVPGLLIAKGSLLKTGAGTYSDFDAEGKYQYHNFRRFSSFIYNGQRLYIADSVLTDSSSTK
jgi:hypothetical protein